MMVTHDPRASERGADDPHLEKAVVAAMTLIRLMLRNTIRRPVRLALTIGGLAMVVLAFGLLRLTLDERHSGVKAAANNRLITVLMPCPIHCFCRCRIESG
ncbi:MAG: hypothetical protein U0231_08925 [Nitrospiraceae bacterium]